MSSSKRPSEDAEQSVRPAKRQRTEADSSAGKTPVLVHQSLKTIAKSAKKARTFEGQKITRRLKKVEDAAEKAELQAELESIKASDIDRISNHGLQSFIDNHPEHIARFGWTKSETQLDDTKAEDRAIKRILASKGMKEGFDALHARFGGGVAGVKKTKQKAQSKTEERDGKVQSDDSATSSDQKAKSTTKKSKVSANSAKSSKVQPTATASTFLPSLSAGFTLGDSDGDDDGYRYSDSAEENTTKPERKNRRGQQARQKIWERKYGKDAKHVVKSREAEKMAQAAIDAKKRARSGRPANPNSTTLGAPEAQRPAQTPVEHPSWQAKRRQTEAVASAAFAGKKTTFG